GGFGDLEALLKISVPQRDGVLVEAMNDLREGHAELVLVACGLDAILDIRQFLAERPDARQSARRAFHEGGEIRTEKIETGVGESTEVARLQGGARDDERAAERAFLAGLGVALIGHQLGAGSAHVTLDVLIEERPWPR